MATIQEYLIRRRSHTPDKYYAKAEIYDIINNEYVFGNHASKVALETFLMNGDTKILKNGSGDVYVVDIANVSVQYDDILVNSDLTQPYYAKFSWVEIADISEV